MKKLLLFIFLVLFPSCLYSAFLRSVPQEITQPNGAVIHCFASGDEYNNWLHDADGYTIIQSKADGYYYYAEKNGDSLVPSLFRVGRMNPHKTDLQANLIPHRKNTQNHLKDCSVFKPQNNTSRKKAKVDNLQINSVGTVNNIVVFICFADDAEDSLYVPPFNTMFNGVDTSSLRDYFLQISRNLLTVNSHFFPSASGNSLAFWRDTASRNFFRPYSATNPIGYSNDNEVREREHGLLARAINGISGQIPENIDFDNDNDGYIDNICFVVSGNAEGWNDLLWPHMWGLYTQNVNIGTSRVYDYNFQLADYMTNNGGTGVLCHEFFHTLGSPDLYHYSYDTLYPVGYWDIMSLTLDPPQFASVYTRWQHTGWIGGLSVISSIGKYTLNKSTAATRTMYAIGCGDPTGEYIFLEYRKIEGRYESSLLLNGGLVASRVVPYLDGNAEGPPDEFYVFRPGGSPTTRGFVNRAALSEVAGRTSAGYGTSMNFFDSRGNDIGVQIDSVQEMGDSVSFYVRYVPVTPRLLVPKDGDTAITKLPVFVWSKQTVSAISHFQLSRNSTFTDLVKDTLVSATRLSLNTALSNGTNYFWRIRVESLDDTTDWAPASFKVISANRIKYISESFEESAFPPTCWRSNFFTGGYVWEKVSSGTKPTCIVPHGNSMITYKSANATAGYQGILWIPAQNMQLTKDNTVSFRMYRDGYSGSDRVIVYANSIQSANTATIIGRVYRRNILAPSADSAGWYDYIFCIPDSLAGLTCNIGIAGYSGHGYNLLVDKIEIEGNLITAPVIIAYNPADSSDEIDASGFLHYQSDAVTDSFEIVVFADSLLTDTVLHVFTTADSVEYSDLNCGTKYYWKVRAFNIAGGGNWSAVKRFSVRKANICITGNILYANLYNGISQKIIAVTAELRSGRTMARSVLYRRQAVLLDSNGYFNFSFAGVEKGKYKLIIKLPGYLSAVMNTTLNVTCGANNYNFNVADTAGVLVGENIILATLPNGKKCIKCGDLDTDGNIGITDWMLLMKYLGTTSELPY